MTIKEALQQLNPENDAQWTSDGLPLVDVVCELTGNPGLTRKEITEADPQFCRAAMTKKEEPPAKPKTRDEELHEELEQVVQEIADLLEKRNVLDAAIRARQQRWKVLTGYFNRQRTGNNDTQERLDYIRKQNKIRADRAQRSRQILKGIDLSAIDAKAPIDQAMSRKNTRGTQRPMPKKE